MIPSVWVGLNLYYLDLNLLIKKSQCALFLPPGIATFSNSPETAFTSIQPLLEFSLSHIPASQHSHTVLYIFGTAGMRLLPKEEQRRIVEVLYERVSQEFPFHLPKDGVQVISGKMEGEECYFHSLWLMVGIIRDNTMI